MGQKFAKMRNSVQVRWTTLLKDAYLRAEDEHHSKAFMFWNSFLPYVLFLEVAFQGHSCLVPPFWNCHALMSICLEKWLITKFLYCPDTWIKYSRKSSIHFHSNDNSFSLSPLCGFLHQEKWKGISA